MLIDFSFSNFLSFGKPVTFSMQAAKTVKELATGETSNVFKIDGNDLNLLKTSAVYGANGSGKSNLIDAMSFFRHAILNSASIDNVFSRNKLFFLFDNKSESLPTSFEMVFLVDGIKYRHGFEILNGQIITEWLFCQSANALRESYCFKREKNKIQINSKTFKGAAGLNSKTRSNALFLSVAAQFNVSVALAIRSWLRKKFNVISGLEGSTLSYTASQYRENSIMHSQILDFIKLSDTGIVDINIIESPKSTDIIENVGQIESAPLKVSKKYDILSFHDYYSDGEILGQTSIPFALESLGTKKIFSLSGPWFDTLRNGGVLVVDEFGASLHTQMSIELTRLFQSPLNVSNAQLIVITHDTNLLRRDLFRRDQIWFVEKDSHGVSDLYSLVEYKINQATSVRNNASYEKDYLMGKYGAIPFFGNLEKFLLDYGKRESI